MYVRYVSNLHREELMASVDRVKKLKTKHEEYETAIAQESNRPHPDEIQLHDMKRQKLRIKDEINRLSSA